MAIHNTCLLAASNIDKWESVDIFGILDNGSTDRDYDGADQTTPKGNKLGGQAVRSASTFVHEGRGAPVVPVGRGVGE